MTVPLTCAAVQSLAQAIPDGPIRRPLFVGLAVIVTTSDQRMIRQELRAPGVVSDDWLKALVDS